MQDIGVYLTKKALEFIAFKEKCDVSDCQTIAEMILKLLKNRLEKIEQEEHGLLEKYGIRSRSDMKKWMIKNHPDRGGDSEIFIKVLREFKQSGLK